jgi:hypothetical protein
MDSFDRRLNKMQQQFSPAPPTALDRKRLHLLEEGVRRVREDREAPGQNSTGDDDDEGLPAKPHTSQGIQLTVDILHDGRERNYLRWLKAKQISDSTAPVGAVLCR